VLDYYTGVLRQDNTDIYIYIYIYRALYVKVTKFFIFSNGNERDFRSYGTRRDVAGLELTDVSTDRRAFTFKVQHSCWAFSPLKLKTLLRNVGNH
jgi:hypothetical protein